MTGPLAEAWATPASRRKILLGELPQRLDLGLAHSGVQAPGAEPPGKYWSTFDDVVALSRYLQMKLISIFIFYFLSHSLMNCDTLLCHLACRVKFHINEHCNDSLITYKKIVLNLDDFNRVWIYLWKRMESFALSSALEIISSVSAPYEVSSLSLVLFKQPGHIADYCKMSNDNN